MGRGAHGVPPADCEVSPLEDTDVRIRNFGNWILWAFSSLVVRRSAFAEKRRTDSATRGERVLSLPILGEYIFAGNGLIILVSGMFRLELIGGDYCRRVSLLSSTTEVTGGLSWKEVKF
jgi:hypothetical protein